MSYDLVGPGSFFIIITNISARTSRNFQGRSAARFVKWLGKRQPGVCCTPEI